jgi:hypothetical protein
MKYPLLLTRIPRRCCTIDYTCGHSADRIAARLAGDDLRIWIVDEQGIQDRNAIIVCLPEKQLHARSVLDDVMHSNHEHWSIRRGRLRSGDLAYGSRNA